MSNREVGYPSDYYDQYAWCEWTLNHADNSYFRARVSRDGQPEYEYWDEVNAPPPLPSSSFATPRSSMRSSASNFYPGNQIGQQEYSYQSESDYNYDDPAESATDVDGLSNTLRQTRISEHPTSTAIAFIPARASRPAEYGGSASAPATSEYLTSYQLRAVNVPAIVREEFRNTDNFQYSPDTLPSIGTSSPEWKIQADNSHAEDDGQATGGEGSSSTSRCDTNSTMTATPSNMGRTISIPEGETRAIGDAEKLDPRYQVQPSSMFKPFNVFMVLWTESSSHPSSSISEVTKFSLHDVKFGEKAYCGIRRFVIINSGNGHSQCVQIMTYGHQGTLKKGITVDTHGIVYTGDKPPKPLKGESRLSWPPVQIIGHSKRDKLSSKSRVNYAKIYTVEHNVKVLFVGKIAKECQHQFRKAVNEVWESRTSGD